METSNRRSILRLGLGAAGASFASVLLAAPLSASEKAAPPGSRDFDFLVGKWRIRNQRRKQRAVGSTEWDGYEATLDCRSLLGGVANVDEFAAVDRGIRGASFRVWNAKTERWSDYWVNQGDGVLGPPMLGAFENGVGRFEGHDEDGGKPVAARALWSEITPTSLKWEQAFSYDEGKTWETNWRMQGSRVGSAR